MRITNAVRLREIDTLEFDQPMKPKKLHVEKREAIRVDERTGLLKQLRHLQLLDPIDDETIGFEKDKT